MYFDDIVELDKYNIMADKDVEPFAFCLAAAFKEYPLFEYFSKNKYNIDKMVYFWKVTFKAGKGQIFSFSDSKEPKAVCLLEGPDYNDSGFWGYVAAGGLGLVSRFGANSVANMLRFEDFAAKIRKKYSTPNCCYLYILAVHPDHRGKGIGSDILNSLMTYFDRTDKDCYLETMDTKNVTLYQRSGFILKESVQIPGTNMTLYAMFRKSNYPELF